MDIQDYKEARRELNNTTYHHHRIALIVTDYVRDFQVTARVFMHDSDVNWDVCTVTAYVIDPADYEKRLALCHQAIDSARTFIHKRA